MKSKRLKITLVMLALLGVPLIIQSCGSAGAPTPPVETPSPIVLKMVNYDNIAIDFTRLTQVGAASLDIDKAVGLFSDISYEIWMGGDVATSINANVADAVGLISSLEVPWGSATYATTLFVEKKATSMDFYADFSAFDYNGSGNSADENCSGIASDNDAGRPICGRIWWKATGTEEWSRLFAFVYEVVEHTEAAVAVPIKVRLRNEIVEFVDPPVTDQLALNYDLTDAQNAFVEQFSRAISYETSIKTMYYGDTHTEMYRAGAEGTALKTVSLDTRLVVQVGDNDPGTVGSAQFYSQYRDDGTYWRGAANDTLWKDLQNFDFACALLTTGIVIEDPLVVPPPVSICASISTDAVYFARPLEAADVEFFDFPATPTL